jgi:hypothetical protein
MRLVTTIKEHNLWFSYIAAQLEINFFYTPVTNVQFTRKQQACKKSSCFSNLDLHSLFLKIWVNWPLFHTIFIHFRHKILQFIHSLCNSLTCIKLPTDFSINIAVRASSWGSQVGSGHVSSVFSLPIPWHAWSWGQGCPNLLADHQF